MHQSTPRLNSVKPALAALFVVVVPILVTGCDPDSHPSQMVKMREQMAQQRQGMKSSNGAQAPGTPPPGKTGP